MLYCSINKFLKEVRKYKKMTLQEVVNSCHTGKGALSEFENGKRNPSNNTIRRLLDFYNVKYVLNTDDDIESYLNGLKNEELYHYLNNHFFIISIFEKNVYLLEQSGIEKKGDYYKILLDNQLRELNEKNINDILTDIYIERKSNEGFKSELNGSQIKALENIKIEKIQDLTKLLNDDGLDKVLQYILDIKDNIRYKK